MDAITKNKIDQLMELVWGEDIPSPTCPEYKEHHESIQKIIRFIDAELLSTPVTNNCFVCNKPIAKGRLCMILAGHKVCKPCCESAHNDHNISDEEV